MAFVRLTCEAEAVVEVDLPLDAGLDALREAAMIKLVESGGVEWETVSANAEASEEPILYSFEDTGVE